MPPFRKRIYTARAFARDGAGVAREAPRLARVYLLRGLAPGLRERVWLAVSGVNACRYCLFVHGAWGRRAGLGEREIGDLARGRPDPRAGSDEAAVTYAQAWAERELRGAPAEIAAWFRESYPEAVRRRVEAVARMANLANRTGNTFDALLSRARGAPAPGSRLRDELAVSAVFLAAAAVVAPAMALAGRTPPLAMLRAFRAVSRGEAPVPARRA